MKRNTVIAIHDEHFLINDQLTYSGCHWRGHRIEGLLLNSRMVQGIFDDLNPATRSQWDYPDGPWNPQRNTREFVAQMPVWRRHGLLSFTINLQGGSPHGYSREQPWINSAFQFNDGSLRDDYMARLAKILDRADQLGMAPIVGFFYFGQEPRFAGEDAILRAADNATDWLVDRGYTNVLVEITNECNVRYRHEIIQPARAHELIERVQRRSSGKLRTPAGRLLVSTSYGGGTVPQQNVAKAADYLLLHGNGVNDPNRITQMVRQTRSLTTYHGQPIVFNEDDHFNFDQPQNNLTAAVASYASWGYFDYRMKGEGYDAGYQSLPVNWGISSARKRSFFNRVAEMTGSAAD